MSNKEYPLTDLFNLYHHTELDYRVLSKIKVMRDQKSYDQWFYKVTYINGEKDKTICPTLIIVDKPNNVICCKSLNIDKIVSFSDIKSIEINYSSCLKRFIDYMYIPEKSCLRIKTSIFYTMEIIGTYLNLSSNSEREYIRILTKDGIREIFLNYIDSVEDYEVLVEKEFENLMKEKEKSTDVEYLESELSEYETEAELVERQLQENCKELNNCFRRMEERGFSIDQVLPFTGANGFNYYLVIGKRKRKVN